MDNLECFVLVVVDIPTSQKYVPIISHKLDYNHGTDTKLENLIVIFNLSTVGPRDTRPQAARTSTMHVFE